MNSLQALLDHKKTIPELLFNWIIFILYSVIKYAAICFSMFVFLVGIESNELDLFWILFYALICVTVKLFFFYSSNWYDWINLIVSILIHLFACFISTYYKLSSTDPTVTDPKLLTMILLAMDIDIFYWSILESDGMFMVILMILFCSFTLAELIADYTNDATIRNNQVVFCVHSICMFAAIAFYMSLDFIVKL